VLYVTLFHTGVQDKLQSIKCLSFIVIKLEDLGLLLQSIDIKADERHKNTENALGKYVSCRVEQKF
jgi:hypothetical protein